MNIWKSISMIQILHFHIHNYNENLNYVIQTYTMITKGAFHMETLETTCVTKWSALKSST